MAKSNLTIRVEELEAENANLQKKITSLKELLNYSIRIIEDNDELIRISLESGKRKMRNISIELSKLEV